MGDAFMGYSPGTLAEFADYAVYYIHVRCRGFMAGT